MKKVLAALLTILALVSQVHLTYAQMVNDWIVEDISFKSSTGGDVYPGSSNTNLIIIARYKGITGDSARHPLACIEPPSGFEVIGPKCKGARSIGNEYVSNVTAGETVSFEFTLNVDRTVRPGGYIAMLKLSYFIGSVYYQDYLNINLYVAQYPPLAISIEEVYMTPYSYPGSCPVSMNVKIRNNGDTTITSMRLTLKLPDDIATPSTVNVTLAQSLNSGGSTIASFPNICIDPRIIPGLYMARLRVAASLMTRDGVSYDSEAETGFEFNIGQAPGIRIHLLDYSLTSNMPLPGLNNTGIRIVLQSHEPSLIRLTHFYVVLNGAESINGSSTIIIENNINMDYLDVTELVFGGLVIHENASYVMINITTYGIIQRDGGEYPSYTNMLLLIPLRDIELNIKVERVEWGNTYAYPNSTGNTLVVSLLNLEELSIRASVVTLELPSGMFYPNRIIAYNVIIQGMSITQISFPGISIGEVTKPDVYRANLTIHGFIQCNDGSARYLRINKEIPVVVYDISALKTWMPNLTLVSAFWGEGTPQYVYPGNPRVGLTLVVQNTGLYIASDVVITLIPIDRSIKTLSDSVVCGSINPGGVCQAVFYLDLANADPGLKQFSALLTYSLSQLGSRSRFNQLVNFTLFLPEFTAGKSMEIASAGWLNNNPVYPRTKGAVYSVTLANLEPFPVYSIWVTMDLPSCMKIHEGFSSTTYIAGPVTSLQTTSISFTIDLACQPGIYGGVVKIDYYVQYYGGGYRKYIEKPVEIVISDDRSSVEIISAGWISGLPILPAKGINYVIIVRNREFPSISSPVMKIKLPEGFVESYSGSNMPNITPTYIVPSTRLQGMLSSQVITPEVVLSLITRAPATQTSSAIKGDVMAFVLTLNIENITTGSYEVPFELSFIDHWGYEYSVNSSFTIMLLKKPPLVMVNATSPLVVFSNGTAILDIEILNEYDASIYNVYVALIPATGIAIPQGNVKYIDEIPGKTSLCVRYDLLYNPISISGMQISPQTLSSMSAVFTVTVIYKDYSGMVSSINSTIAVLIKPFINIEVTDLSARYQGNILTVNGVVVNTGLTKARSLVIYVYYGDVYSYTLVGDVDPASQVPFRVTLGSPLIGDECKVIVKYMDDYGLEYSISKSILIKAVSLALTTPVSPGATSIDTYRLMVVLITVIFLSAVFLVLYVYLKKRQGVTQ